MASWLSKTAEPTKDQETATSPEKYEEHERKRTKKSTAVVAEASEQKRQKIDDESE